MSLAQVLIATQADGRQMERHRLSVIAKGYSRERSEASLRHFLPGRLANRAMAYQDDTATTWAVIRHLCKTLRADRRARRLNGAAARVKRDLLAGEVGLLARQRADRAVTLPLAAE